MSSTSKAGLISVPGVVGITGIRGDLFNESNPTYEAIWNHVYHKQRLYIQNPNHKTIQGTIAKIRQEPDGDYHGYFVQANPHEFEIICACKITQQDAVQPCHGYINKIRIPKVGDKVTITGLYVYDEFHNQYEIHPVYVLK